MFTIIKVPWYTGKIVKLRKILQGIFKQLQRLRNKRKMYDK